MEMGERELQPLQARRLHQGRFYNSCFNTSMGFSLSLFFCAKSTKNT